MSDVQSPQTTAQSEVPPNDSTSIDNSSGPQPPSHTVQPRRISTEPQQGSTSPGDGSKVHYDAEKNINYVEQPGETITWKDQVLGYAKEIRGTVLRKPDTKEHGHQILEGQASPEAPRPIEKD